MISAVVLLSDPQRIQQAQEDFARLGFDVTPVAGGSLLVSGEPVRFESTFAVKLVVSERGSVMVSERRASGPKAGRAAGANEQSIAPPSLSLPIGRLPATMQPYLDKVEFERPLDFGPADFSGAR